MDGPLPTLPDYEILGVLGRGGMGVVYQARHLALNRIVAIKMLRSASAGERERARFKAEAEAVARLQHPGIVQVFEVGDHAGRPFCALEFVEGGSLATRLAAQPLPPRAAAGLVEALARAMHLAHSRNVIHRDLKPANILLSADGSPKVTDFGLARQLDADSGQTLAGQVMGTPSYMAPEQASGRAHEAGPAADVYALGAILYECLTGRPPFLGATLLETLEMVRTTEPARLPAQVSADLATIALKCLRKEPEKRYASAEALAEDLHRWQAGEPILARPVGWLEGAVKWVRRRPALAGLLGALVATILIGLGVSTYLAFEANWQATQALVSKEAAEKSATRATENEQKARDALARVELTLAQNLLRPVGYQEGPLTEAELNAVWDLAQSDSDRVRYLFLEKALERPETAVRLNRRAAVAALASVGLDADRRGQVQQLLQAKLSAGRHDLRVREACVSLGRALDFRDAAFARAAAPTVFELLSQAPYPPAQRAEQAKRLAVLGVLLNPDEVAGLVLKTIERMAVMSAAAGPGALGETVALLAPRLEPAAAAAALRKVLDTMDRAVAGTFRSPASAWVRVAIPLAARLSPEDAGPLARRVLDSMARIATQRGDNESLVLHERASILHAVAARLERRAAAEIGQAAVQQALAMLARTRLDEEERYAVGRLGACLETVADLLEKSAATTTAQTLVATVERAESKLVIASQLTPALKALSRSLAPEEAARVAGVFPPLLRQGQENKLLFAHCLPELVVWLGSEEAAGVTLDAILGTTDPAVLEALHTTWAARLDGPGAAATLAKTLEALAGARQVPAMNHLLRILQVQIPRVEAAAVGPALRKTFAVTPAIQNPLALMHLNNAVAQLAARLTPEQAAALAPEIVAGMAKTTAPATLLLHAQVLGNLPAPPELALATGWYNAATREVLAALVAPGRKPADIFALTTALHALPARPQPAEAGQQTAAAEQLLAELDRTRERYPYAYLCRAVIDLAARLEPEPAGKLHAALGQKMLATVTQGRLDGFAPEALQKPLAVLMAKLEPAAATRLAECVVRWHVSSIAPGRWGPTGHNAVHTLLALLLPRLPAKALGEVATQLLEGMQAGLPDNLPLLARVFAELAAQLDREAAAALAQKVVAALGRHSLPAGRAALGYSLAALARRLDRDAGRRVAFAGAVRLVEITANPKDQRALVAALTGLVEQLDAANAVELLKHPLCGGDSREAVLTVWGKRAGRPFADLWELVAWLAHRESALDLAAPARRPE